MTGGYGFGGSHLCEQLLKRGARVYVMDRETPTNSYLVLAGLADRVHYFYGDVRDMDLLKTSLERFQIDTIFHLAAQPVVPIFMTRPYESLSINVMGTYAVLEAMRTSPMLKRWSLPQAGHFTARPPNMNRLKKTILR